TAQPTFTRKKRWELACKPQHDNAYVTARLCCEPDVFIDEPKMGFLHQRDDWDKAPCLWSGPPNVHCFNDIRRCP
ncbi:hypothetical protein PMAYCL1PPCAC_14646, partial [Pristionchus mayeri]